MDWSSSKYCFHPPSTAVDMLIADDFIQTSRNQRKLGSVSTQDHLFNVPEPVMKLIRKRERNEKT